MFIMSLKINNNLKQLFKNFFLWVLFSTAIGAIIIININKNVSQQTQSKLNKPISLCGQTNEDRVNFFKNFGWISSSEPCEISDVLIPQKFDNIFQDYNKIQQKQNLDLSKYKGKLVKHYSYEITNYPHHSENIRGNLLIYNGQIIASDICSLDLDGFMHEVYKLD